MTNPMRQHGAFSWNELVTSDIEGAKAFYKTMFGWQCEDVDGDMPYTMAKIGNQEVAGLMATTPECAEMPPMWGGYITVEDVDASAKKCESLGGKILVEARDIPNVGHFCVMTDPQGAMITIITYLATA